MVSPVNNSMNNYNTAPITTNAGSANQQPKANSQSAVGIYCNLIDPSKLTPEQAEKLFKNGMSCSFVGPGGNQPCYPAGYYMNNYNNTVKKRVTVLTDAYVKNLEQLLENEDPEYREYGASEVMKRLEEDKTRYNNPAMNALVNKMILDPYDRKVRERGLIAITGNYAKGDKNTPEILEYIKSYPDLTDFEKGEIERAKSALTQETTLTYVPIGTSGV